MFGFSLGKLLFTVGAIVAIWYGFKMIGRFQERQKEMARTQKDELRRETKRNSAPNPKDVEEMVECRTCGAYVALNGATDCGKPNCPYPK